MAHEAIVASIYWYAARRNWVFNRPRPMPQDFACNDGLGGHDVV
jgi:hypothetical protein